MASAAPWGAGEEAGQLKARDDEEREAFAKWAAMTEEELTEEMKWWGVRGKILRERNRLVRMRQLVRAYRTRFELVYEGPEQQFVVDALVPEQELALLRQTGGIFSRAHRARAPNDHERVQSYFTRSFYVVYDDPKAHKFNPKFNKSMTVISKRGPTMTLSCTLGQQYHHLTKAMTGAYEAEERAERKARAEAMAEKAIAHDKAMAGIRRAAGRG